MLQNLQGFQYATSLDLNMLFYHKQINNNTSNLFTIIHPWDKYKQKRSPRQFPGGNK